MDAAEREFYRSKLRKQRGVSRQKNGEKDFTAETQRPRRNAEMLGKVGKVNRRGREEPSESVFICVHLRFSSVQPSRHIFFFFLRFAAAGHGLPGTQPGPVEGAFLFKLSFRRGAKARPGNGLEPLRLDWLAGQLTNAVGAVANPVELLLDS